MSYSGTTTEEPFDGNGSTTAFAYQQNTSAAADVHVAIISEDGVPTSLTNGTHYDLAGVGGTGGITVTYPKASSPPAPFDVTLTATEKIIVWVAPVTDQPFSNKNNDTYSPSVLEVWMDGTRRQLQKLEANVARCFHVPLGTAAPSAAATLALAGSKILLATDTVTAAATASVTSNNWPATYDRVELEFVGIAPASESTIVIKPIDNGSATGTSLSITTNTINGTSSSVTTRSSWALEIAQDIGATADDWLTGSAVFHYFNAGFLGGFGHFTHRRSSTLYGQTAHFLRHTTVGTRWDGFQLSTDDAANLSGTIRLWGIPKT